MSDRRWVKLWRDWYTTKSHRRVGADALHVGAVLLTLVDWKKGEDGAWALLPDGSPMTEADIAIDAQMVVSRARRGLAALALRQTIVRRNDGAWGFPKFGRWQETADAARKRKVDGKSAGTSAETPKEGEGEGEADLTTQHDRSPSDETTNPHDTCRTKRAAKRRSASPDGSAGGVAEMRRKRAKDAWTWHEEQRASRLHRGDRAEIREPTREDLDRIVRLHAHIRKRHGLDEEMGWKWVWAFRESRLAATEIALREASPEAQKLVGYARGDAAWSRKAFDIFGTARPKEQRTTAQDRDAFERAVEARKREVASGPA